MNTVMCVKIFRLGKVNSHGYICKIWNQKINPQAYSDEMYQNYVSKHLCLIGACIKKCKETSVLIQCTSLYMIREMYMQSQINRLEKSRWWISDIIDKLQSIEFSVYSSLTIKDLCCGSLSFIIVTETKNLKVKHYHLPILNVARGSVMEPFVNEPLL